jgi:hypothetical protein
MATLVSWPGNDPPALEKACQKGGEAIRGWICTKSPEGLLGPLAAKALLFATTIQGHMKTPIKISGLR